MFVCVGVCVYIYFLNHINTQNHELFLHYTDPCYKCPEKAGNVEQNACVIIMSQLYTFGDLFGFLLSNAAVIN